MQKQVIEFNGEAVGALVPDGDRLRFIAVKFNVWNLDGRLFTRSLEARRAIMAHLSTSQTTTSVDRASLVAARAHSSRIRSPRKPVASVWAPGDGDLPV